MGAQYVDDEGRQWPPTLEIVLKAGYSREAAVRIVAEEQAKCARGEVPPDCLPKEPTMKFHNPMEHPLDFQIGDQRYKVAVGGEVNIPDRLAYCVRAYGLPLKEGPSPVAAAAQARVEAARAPIRLVPASVAAAQAAPPPPDEFDEDEEENEDDGSDAPSDPSAPAEGPVEQAVAALRTQGVRLRKRP